MRTVADVKADLPEVGHYALLNTDPSAARAALESWSKDVLASLNGLTDAQRAEVYLGLSDRARELIRVPEAALPFGSLRHLAAGLKDLYDAIAAATAGQVRAVGLESRRLAALRDSGADAVLKSMKRPQRRLLTESVPVGASDDLLDRIADAVVALERRVLQRSAGTSFSSRPVVITAQPGFRHNGNRRPEAPQPTQRHGRNGYVHGIHNRVPGERGQVDYPDLSTAG